MYKCVPAVVCLVVCVASVFHFSCAGIECAHYLRNADWREVAAACSRAHGRETVCTSHAPVLCRPPRASIARSPELDSLSSDHYEPTSSLVTLWVKKRLLSCRPLRVRSLLVGSTVRHLGTPYVRWSACASHPLIWMNALRAPISSNRWGSLQTSHSSDVHKGFLGGVPVPHCSE